MDGLILGGFLLSFPLAPVGVYYLFKDKVKPELYRKRGFVLVYKILPNGQIKSFWAKPEFESKTTTVQVPVVDEKGEPVKDKDGNVQYTTQEVNFSGYFIEDKTGEGKLQMIDDPDKVVYKGNIKNVFYDAEGNQISFQNMVKLMPAAAPALLDALGKRTWNIARATAFGEKKKLELLVLLSLVANICVLGYLVYVNKRITELGSVVGSIKATVVTLAKLIKPPA